MATTTELYREILNNLGVDCDNLPDNLTTTLLKAIAQNCGGGGSAGGGSAGGGVATAIFKNDEYADDVVSCINMMFEEARRKLINQEPLSGVICWHYDNGISMLLHIQNYH